MVIRKSSVGLGIIETWLTGRRRRGRRKRKEKEEGRRRKRTQKRNLCVHVREKVGCEILLVHSATLAPESKWQSQPLRRFDDRQWVRSVVKLKPTAESPFPISQEWACLGLPTSS